MGNNQGNQKGAAQDKRERANRVEKEDSKDAVKNQLGRGVSGENGGANSGARDGVAADANPKPAEMSNNGVQGEGDYQAARAFNESERRFVASGKVEAAARAAAPKSEAEQQAMLAAEVQGKRRAKDPIPPPTTDRTGPEPAVGAPGRKRP